MFRSLSSLTRVIELKKERTRLVHYNKVSVRLSHKMHETELRILALEQEIASRRLERFRWSREDWDSFDACTLGVRARK